MRYFLQLLIKYHFVILFIALEIVCVVFIVNYNYYQQAAYMNSAERLASNINRTVANWTDYIALKQVNDDVSSDNQYLRNVLANFTPVSPDSLVIADSNVYVYRKAKIVNASHSKEFNYITIDKGTKHGLAPDMAVVGSQGVVGIIVKCSENFSIILPIINSKFYLSVRLQVSDYYGSLTWDGSGSRDAMLNEIPFHVKISNGEQIVTSGFSDMFPANIPVGYVSEYGIEDGNFYKIRVKLATNFENLKYVYVIQYKYYNEKMELEKSMMND